MHRVLLNFDHHGSGFSVHFIESDCCTAIGVRTRYFSFRTADDLLAFVLRCTLDDITTFDDDMRRWARGSVYYTLTADQYAKLL